MKIQTTNKDNKISKAINNKLSAEEIAVIKSICAKNTTDTELAALVFISEKLGLNPLNKEIWCYKDQQKNLIIFAGRDGFLKVGQKDKRWNGITSSEVREKDFFELDIPNGIISHKPKYSEDRGKIIGAYCKIKPQDCEIATIEWVDFNTYDKGNYVWKSHPADMIKKVAEIHALKKAHGISGIQSEYDYQILNDTAYPIDAEEIIDNPQLTQIEYLLTGSSIGEDEVEEFRQEISDKNIPSARLSDIIEYLKQNQLDPVSQGHNYSQTDIQKKLDSIDKDESK